MPERNWVLRFPGTIDKNILQATTNSWASGRDTARTLSSAPTETNRLRIALAWTGIYSLLSCLTGAFFMSDTVDYVGAVYGHDLGSNNSLWEFGHLFWRPLGWILLHSVGPWVGSFTGTDRRVEVTYLFVALNWLAGLACVLLLRAVLGRFSIRPAAANFATLAFLFSLAFLNYIHSGSSYIPGLAFLLLGFYLLSVPAPSESFALRPVWAACALALAVCLWFPYVFAVPGALATPLFHHEAKKSSWAFTLRTTVYCLILGLASYGVVLAALGIVTPEAVFRWITTESREIGGVHGPARTIFGLCRSFISMGGDGVLFKRFLLHDPYNSVTMLDLLRASLSKLFLFYAFLFAMLTQLTHSGNRKILWLCLGSATPVIVFALFWYGGDMERYLPLYPAFFFAVGYSLSTDRIPRYLTWLAGTFLLVAAFSNFGATSNFTLRQEQRRVEERMREVIPLLRPGSRVVLLDIHDELENFGRSFPFHPIVGGQMLRTFPLLNIGTLQTTHWRQDFAVVVLTNWRYGNDIWISKRILETRPHRDWNWVEGADPRATWPMIRSSFTRFDYGRSAGDEDGFLLLLPTDKNKTIIDSFRHGDATL
jgi:hypothetical protein